MIKVLAVLCFLTEFRSRYPKEQLIPFRPSSSSWKLQPHAVTLLSDKLSIWAAILALGQKICTVDGSLEASRLARGTLVLVQVEKFIISAQHTKKARELPGFVGRGFERGWTESWAFSIQLLLHLPICLTALLRLRCRESLSIPTKIPSLKMAPFVPYHTSAGQSTIIKQVHTCCLQRELKATQARLTLPLFPPTASAAC